MTSISAHAIKNHIVFKFNDKVDHDGKFIQSHDTFHIVSGDFEKSAQSPRWATVVTAGPTTDSDVCQPGTQILIENLKWTMGFKVDGVMLWRTDDTHVLAVGE